LSLERILSRKILSVESSSFKTLHHNIYPQKPSQNLIKNILTSTFSLVSTKLKANKEIVFRTLLKQFGL
jgi:hypothetical protein